MRYTINRSSFTEIRLMEKCARRIFMASATAAMLLTTTAAVCAEEPLKVLSIGNSFSVNAHAMLPQIAESMGRQLVLGNAVIGGGPMQSHVSNFKAYEASTNAPRKGVIYNYKKRKASLGEMLRDEKWDYVTVQQFSWQSFVPDSYEPSGTELLAYIATNAPGAKVLVHETWAYRADEQRLVKSKMTPNEMYERVAQTYREFAERHGLRVIPSGLAFNLATNSEGWGAVPATGEAGGEAAPWSTTLYIRDGYHAGRAGEYLLGCVWFEFLFGEDIRALKFVPKGLSEEDAAILREIAHKAVAQETNGTAK